MTNIFVQMTKLLQGGVKMNSLEELKSLVDIESITAITTNSASLSIKETLELMDGVSLDNLNTELTFWTKDQKVVVYETEEDWGTEIELVRVSLKPSKGLIKGTPESVTDVWQDPESGKYLPFKTKSCHEKEKADKDAREARAKKDERRLLRNLDMRIERITEQFSTLPKVQEAPFTIIKGGFGENCRYITLPKNFPISKTAYGLIGEFYNGMNSDLRGAVDFSGFASMNGGKLEASVKYAPQSIEEHYSEERVDALNKYNDLYEKLENDGKIVKVVGFCIETMRHSEMGTLDEVAEKLREELRALSL